MCIELYMYPNRKEQGRSRLKNQTDIPQYEHINNVQQQAH